MIRTYVDTNACVTLCGDCFDIEATRAADTDAYVARFEPMSGESDYPAHCDACGEFLENALTECGRASVLARAAVRDAMNEHGKRLMRVYMVHYELPECDVEACHNAAVCVVDAPFGDHVCPSHLVSRFSAME